VVDFQTLNDTCVLIKGKTLGSSKSCWTICDTLGVCDTLVITVTVADNLLPIAVDDSITIKRNRVIDIQVMKNDTINGTFKRITLMTEPKYGTGVFEKDTANNWIFRYTPKLDYCSSKYYDEFVYQLCNETGCDLANVKVNIKCDTLIIYDGFSPNGDGKNDFFVVEGIEDYPNTNVIIYNRWGNKLYENKDYKNDWGGTWNNRAVPDGTYFYQVILENGDIHSGYVQIHH
jgi:gliding motility-associated-like protein